MRRESGGAELVERDEALAAVAHVIDAARAGTGRVLVVSGASGSGKTAVLATTATVAGEIGMRTVHARGGELEQGFPFGVVRQLLDAGPELSGPGALAAPVFDETAPGRDLAEATQPILRGLYWLIVGLAEKSPVALIIDDAQWADLASLRFLDYLARRLDDLPVVVVIGVRDTEPGARAQLDAIDAIRSAPRVQLGLLSPDGTAQLLSDRMAKKADALFAAAVYDLTGGNPMLVEQLALELAGQAIEPEAANVRRLNDLVPKSVEAGVLRGLSRLDPEVRPVAEAIAVLGNGTSLLLVSKLAGVAFDAASRAADALADAELLLPSRPLGFRYSMFRGAVLGSIPRGRRSELHRAAAALLRSEGAEASKVASQLLSVEPGDDVEMVEVLLDAGHDSLRRGSPESAATFFRRALDELPPRHPDHAGVLLRYGTALSSLDPEAGSAALIEAASSAADPAIAAEAARAAGYALVTVGRVAAALDVVEHHLQRIEYRGERAVRELARMAGELHWTVGTSLDRSLTACHRYWDWAAEDPRDTGIVAAGKAYVNCQLRCDLPETRELASRAARDEHLARLLGPGDYGAMALVVALLATEQLPEAEELCGRLLSTAVARGEPTSIANCSMWKAWVGTATGDLTTAEADAETALNAARSTGQYLGPPISTLSSVLVETGETERALSLFDESGLDLDGPLPHRPATMTLIARAGTRLSAGRWADAARDLDRIEEESRALGDRNPLLAWRLLRVFTLAVTGRTDEASALAEERLAAAREWGTPRELSAALRVSARIDDQPARRLSMLREAAGAIEGSPARLEEAKTQVALGSELRRQGRRSEARELLSQGWDGALRCGAMGLVDFALSELVATGARPRRSPSHGPSSLTASERRVAQMAVAGRTNREIAEALFVGPKTVSFHLTNCYRKLGVSTREDLIRALEDL
jgi:DNA-binding CsgD family transcriptional regulator/tetratricopeptide (TPR) repeat protein